MTPRGPSTGACRISHRFVSAPMLAKPLLGASRAASSTRIAVSPTCSAPPSTSPVWPPICRCASHAMPIAHAAATSAAHSADCNGSASKAMIKANAACGCRRREIGPAGIGGKSVLARIGQAHRHRRQHAARQRVRGDQALHDNGIRKRRQRRKLGHKAHHQDQRAVGAEPAVAHDLEFRRGVAAAAESVGDIGEGRPRAARRSGSRSRPGPVPPRRDRARRSRACRDRAGPPRRRSRRRPAETSGARGQNSQASRLSDAASAAGSGRRPRF